MTMKNEQDSKPPAIPPLPPATGSAFDRVRLTDATVHQMLAHGRSLEETIVALVCEKNRFTQRIIELESIAPRKIVLPDGRVMVWRCPDELVPEMPNVPDQRPGEQPKS